MENICGMNEEQGFVRNHYYIYLRERKMLGGLEKDVLISTKTWNRQ